MSEKDGGPAFPIPHSDGHRDDNGRHIYTSGMSLRDYFAVHAPLHMLPVFIEQHGIDAKKLARAAYEYADAMLRARTHKDNGND